MYINITDSTTADNKGSSGNLVHYLDKENRLDLEKMPERWFNQDSNTITSIETRRAIDNNIAKLGKVDAKFFLVNISPSQKEIAFLKEKYGEDGAKEQLKAYAASVMDQYALNFKRPGIESNKDLLWFAKLENHRYYSHNDPEVKQGLKKRGEQKPGDQMHVQAIVSRKDRTNKIKLSPMNTSRGKNTEHSKKMGQFDRSAFKESGEKVFDNQFGFNRGLTETFLYANTKKKGNLKERMALHANRENQLKAANLRPGDRKEKVPILALKETPPVQFLKIALAKYGPEVAPSIPKKKKKRKTKDQQQDQDLSF